MIKVGLVGYGFMGHMHAQCHEATGQARIVGLADVEPDRRKEAEEKLKCRAFGSLAEMLGSADIDMVDICTSTYLHEEMAIAAAKAGKHILCEKPMSLTVESCDRMIKAVKKAGVQMMIAQVIRFWPEYRVIKEIVDSGKFGPVEWLSARRLSPPPTWAWQGWLLDPARSGGAVLDLHIHDLDYIAWLIGLPGKVQACGSLGPKGGIDSVLTLGWEHPEGAKSLVEASLVLAPGFPFNMSLLVACEKATIRFDSAASPSLVVYPMQGETFAPPLPAPKVGVSTETQGNIGSLGGYYNEIKYFLDCLEAGRDPEVVTVENAREAVRFSLAVKESAKTGRTVNLK
jgi:predicted dehydrogenase